VLSPTDSVKKGLTPDKVQLLSCLSIIQYNNKEFQVEIHKADFTTTQIYGPKNLVLLILYLGNTF
jgi:hypothetical protein